MLKKKLEIILLVVILLVGFTVRLYRFNGPIADWHSWRQADTASVSRNFVKYGFDLLHPRMNNISNVQSGLENPQGYFFAEFPLYNAAQAGLFVLFHGLTIEEWGRLVTIFMSLCSIVFLYVLGKRHVNGRMGLFAAAFFAVAPYSIYYSRVILPDPSMVAATLGALVFFDLYTTEESPKKSWVWFGISLVCMVLALLFKPYAIFFTLPFFYLAWKRFGFRFLFRWELWLYALLAVLPLGLWRLWMMQYPEGIPANAWLFNGGNVRFTGSYFYWVYAKFIGRLILGSFGLFFICLSLLWTKQKNYWFFISFLFSSLLYVTIIARGNLQHDYYQILIVPTLALLFGLGAEFLLQLTKEYGNKWIAILVLLTASAFMLGFSWYQVRDYFNINNPSLVVAGQAVDRLTPKNAKVIALLDGDSSFLYQTNRQGWASMEHGLPQLIQMGANYLVIANPTQQDIQLGKQYKVVAQTNQYILFNLNKKP